MAIQTTNQAAYDEACRELMVRLRCYEKWVREGKLSRTDASSRLDAQEKIVELLGGLPDVEQWPNGGVARTGDLTKQAEAAHSHGKER